MVMAMALGLALVMKPVLLPAASLLLSAEAGV